MGRDTLAQRIQIIATFQAGYHRGPAGRRHVADGAGDGGEIILIPVQLRQGIGGMGIVVLFVAVFPQLGVGAKHLFKSEVPGPTTEGLRPKIKQTATALWWIYGSLTALCTVLLVLAGMPIFDAICHAFTTMATGGYSTKAHVGTFDSLGGELRRGVLQSFARRRLAVLLEVPGPEVAQFVADVGLRDISHGHGPVELRRSVPKDAAVGLVALEALSPHTSRSILLCRRLSFYHFAALVLWG